MEADGWAVIEDIGLDLRSVSPTRRAALVNWLVTRKNMMATIYTTDEQIERMWDANRGDADVVRVRSFATPSS